MFDLFSVSLKSVSVGYELCCEYQFTTKEGFDSRYVLEFVSYEKFMRSLLRWNDPRLDFTHEKDADAVIPIHASLLDQEFFKTKSCQIIYTSAACGPSIDDVFEQ